MTENMYLKHILISFFLFSFFYFIFKFLISIEKKKIKEKIIKLNLSNSDKRKLSDEVDYVFDECFIEFSEEANYQSIFIIICFISIIPIINFILLFFLLIDFIRNYLMVKKQLNILIKLSTKDTLIDNLLFYNLYHKDLT